MADLEELNYDDLDELDIETLLARVERKPLTFSRKQNLKQAPEFMQRLSGKDTVVEGDDTQLECVVCAFPRPDLSWYKDSDLILPDHPRMSVVEGEEGKYILKIKNVCKGDEAGYKCKAENCEGTSASTFFLFVNVKPKRTPRSKNKRRRVSYPPMFSTIVEKVEEEEVAAKEARFAPPSPLSELYVGITLKSRHTWPKFLGEWAFAEDAIRSCSECSEASEDIMDVPEPDDVFKSDSQIHPLCSILKTSSKQFFLGDIDDNEEIKISRESFDKLNIQSSGDGESSGASGTERNNNFTNKLDKPNNLELTSNGPLFMNNSVSAPEIFNNNMHVHPESGSNLQHTHVHSESRSNDPGKHVQSDASSELHVLGSVPTTNKNSRIKKRKLSGVQIYYRECVLVLIVFTFLALCFGISCGRFIITILGLHVIYAVSKSLLDK
ncbi:hypothetical protein LOTGIDRAFT_169577 [Lottia gigantea]|uniref:Ig-like domain-containing protein n=1 Tax=Lottia gigantea TaxID=225164 RepID=V3YYE9_LOTGI|nr:hypothetical protein LOTGIDRAFT_169577 [Lottia gigantea]ESO83168.1 hypothetical protein LOTGIDRAFT_169577 [Lottia gigantea]